MILEFLQCPIRFASGLFAYVLLATFVGAAHAETPARLDAIVRDGILRVGLTGDYRPFSFVEASGKVKGIDVDMAMSLAQSLGVRLEIVKTSWSTLKSDLETNSFDIAMGGITITLDRQKIGLFSNPVFSSGKTPITHCGDEPKYETMAAIDQPGVRVIVNPGGTNERFDRAHLQKATIVQWSDNATIFDALVERKGDLMITDAVETRVQAKLHPGVLSGLVAWRLCETRLDVGSVSIMPPEQISLSRVPTTAAASRANVVQFCGLGNHVDLHGLLGGAQGIRTSDPLGAGIPPGRVYGTAVSKG
jgi:cyclohexadienyl dehydratase